MAIHIRINPAKLNELASSTDPAKHAKLTIGVGPSHDGSKEVSFYRLDGTGYGSHGTMPIPTMMLPIKASGIVMEYNEYIGLGLHHMRMQLARLAENGMIEVRVTAAKTDLASAGNAWATTLNVNQIIDPSTLP